MDKKDKYIKAKIQQDKEMSNKANEIFKNFEGGIKLENNNKPKERKVFKLSLKQAVLAFSSLMIVAVLGGNLYAHLNGKPNLYSAIKGLFVKEDKYTASEITVDQTVENNGIKLTLKTVAMDENILITKYIAEGEKLVNEFYTYPEFEEDMIDLAKKYFASMSVDIGEEQYKNVKPDDVTEAYNKAKGKLISIGIEESEAVELLKAGHFAYKEYIGAELGGLEETTSEKAQELITQTIAMFEGKVASKYQIMVSNDTLQDFNINVISQKIERNGNQYIIYNVYNVDTISDLASKFNLNVNVTQIGSTNGTWNYSTELEKARLDTRVETIDFYENNSKEVTAYVTTSDKVRHTVKVEVKRLIISDFSSVIMIQTDTNNAPDAKTEGAYSQGAPYVFVITDEEGNVVGTGTRSKEDFESADSKYTDRIILENVNMNTKKLYVKIYEQWDMSEYGDEELTKINDHTIELDIEAARNYSKPVELTQSYVSKAVQVSFKYPVDWKVEETEEKITVTSPENVDGKVAKITISKKTDEKTAKEIVNAKVGDLEKASFEYTSGAKTIAGIEGYYYTVDFGEDIGTRVLVNKENDLYDIEYAGVETEYRRHEDTLNKILETIEFVEPEKSYKTFGNGSIAILKLYEDGVLTITFPTGISEKIRGNETANFLIEDNVEYTVTGNVPDNITNITVMYVADYELETPDIFIETEEKELYYINVINAMNTGKFVVEEKLLDNVVVSSIHRATDEIYENLNIYKDIVFAMVETTDGKIYTIWTNITTGKMTLEEYIEPEENNQGQTMQNTTDAQAKEVIQKYLSIWGTFEGEPLEMLKSELPQYITENIDYEDTIVENGISYVNTNAIYDALEFEMKKYMSYEMFNEYFLSYNDDINPFKNVNGKLYVAQLGTSGAYYEVTEIERMNRNGDIYGYNVYVNTIYGDTTKQETYYIELQSIEGTMFVISIGVG